MDPLLPPLDHEELYVRRGPRSGLPTIVAIHSTLLGPALGGCRMWAYDHLALAVRDALRLARAMTYKAACAGQPLGGGKGVIALPPGVRLRGRRRRDALLDFGETVELLRGRYVTAEDVGVGSRDMAVIAETTGHVSGLPRTRGGSGDPSPLTALGVEVAIRTTCLRRFGDASLRGRSIAVIGLGHVGSRVAARCARAGASLLLADVDPAKRAVAERLGAGWTTPEQALMADVDVVTPCALGGVLSVETVSRMRCRAIAGAANNQLTTDAVAELLHARGILWAPDFVVNAGGIVNIAVELGPDGYDPARARRHVREIGATLAEIYDAADAEGTTPLAAAMARAERRLAAARAERDERPTARAAGAAVRQRLVVRASQARAFAVFTDELGSWWPRRGTSLGAVPAATAVMEPRAGGRWYVRGGDGSECDWGHVLVWEPPERVVLSWEISPDWRPAPSATSEIEVRFLAESPDRTRVEFEHRGLETHGARADKTRRLLEGEDVWRGVLAAFATRAEEAVRDGERPPTASGRPDPTSS